MSSVRGQLSTGHDLQSPDDGLLYGDDLNDDIELVIEQTHCDPIIIPTYSIPVVNAGLGSVKVALGLVEKHSSYPFIASISGVNFLVMLGMNLRYTMEGIKSTVAYLRTRAVPAHWEEISDRKNAAALALTLTTSLTKASTDAILNRYFITRLPIKFNFTDSINMTGWEVFGWSMSGFTFVGTLASGGMAMYVKLRNTVFGGAPTEYSNKFSRYFSPVVGTTLSLTYAISNLSGTIVSVTHTFGITSAPGIAGVCALGMVNSINSQFTNLPFNVNAVDKLCGVFTPAPGTTPAYKNPYSIVSFSFALGAAGLIGYSSRALTKVLLNHSLETIGVNCSSVTDPIVEGISDTTILCNILWVGGALTPLFYDAATGIVSKLRNCGKKPSLDGDVREVEPLIPGSEDDDADVDDFVVIVDDSKPAVAPMPKTPEGGAHRMFQPKVDAQQQDHHEDRHSNGCGIM